MPEILNTDCLALLEASRMECARLNLELAKYGNLILQKDVRHVRVLAALHDAIQRPMGVVPDSAVDFYVPPLKAQRSGSWIHLPLARPQIEVYTDEELGYTDEATETKQ